MSRRTPCREENCDEMALDRAVYCGKHVGQRRRCKKTREVDGRTQRCKKSALIGLDVCEKHGGRFPQSAAQSKRAVALSAMQKFVRPYEGHLDPLTAFEMEYRRTLGRIAWYDEQLAGLADEKDLIWGVTKHEKGTSGGGDGRDGVVNVKTYEARVNILEEMQRWERKHLLDLSKVWINAGLEQKRLDMLGTYIAKTQKMVERAFEHLGLDLNDPKVKAALLAVAPDDYETPPEPQIDVKQIGAPR